MPRNRKEDVTERFHAPFPTNLRDLMGEMNVTQEMLGKHLGVRRQTVGRYMDGSASPSYDSLAKIASYFGVSTDYLLGLAGPDNYTNDEKIRLITERTGLSNSAVGMLSKVSTVFNGQAAVNTLLSNPRFYEFASYLGTYFYGAWVEEFTGEKEGHISSVRKINNDDFFNVYIRPAMLAKMTEIITDIQREIREKEVDNNGKH